MNGAARPFGRDDQVFTSREMSGNIIVVFIVLVAGILSRGNNLFPIFYLQNFVRAAIKNISAGRPGNLEPALAGRRCDTRHSEINPGPILETHDSRGLVFIGIRLPAGLISPETGMRESGDLHNIRLQDLKRIFEKVNTPIVEDAPRNTLAAAPPVARSIISPHVGLNAIDLANNFALVNLFEGFQDTPIPMAVVISRKKEVLLCGFADHRIAFLSRNSQGFFADNMATRAQALQCQFGMGIVWRNNHDKVNIGFVQHCRHRGIGLNTGKFFLCDFQTRFIEFCNRNRRHTRLFHKREMLATHIECAAVADNTHFDIL